MGEMKREVTVSRLGDKCSAAVTHSGDPSREGLGLLALE